jgi:hypothetical protein
MTEYRRSWLLSLAACLALAGPASAQTSTQLVDRAVQAYGDLDFGDAVGLVRRALAASGASALSVEDRLRALSYLGAAEFYRGNRDSVRSAFRSLVELEPRFQLDELIFPPEVASQFAIIKRDTKIVRAVLPPVVRMRSGTSGFAPQLYTSSFHRIAASIIRSDGEPVRLLYSGVIGDSLQIVWGGLDSAGVAVGDGRYFLTIESSGSSGAPERLVQVPLDIVARPLDTLPHPPPPADSLFLPERALSGPGFESLIGGLAGGIGIALLPSSVAPGAELSAGRLAVAGAVTVAGVVGFFRRRPGRIIPANVAVNETLRQDWRERVDAVVRQNITRRNEPILEILVGQAMSVELLEQ